MKVRKPTDDLLPTSICPLIRTVRLWTTGMLRQLQFYLLHHVLCSRIHIRYFGPWSKPGRRWFYHSALYWEWLVGILAISTFWPHEASDVWWNLIKYQRTIELLNVVFVGNWESWWCLLDLCAFSVSVPPKYWVDQAVPFLIMPHTMSTQNGLQILHWLSNSWPRLCVLVCNASPIF